MKDLRATRGRRYILDCIAEGEHVRQDFKHSISNACKIARSISAFANHSGGRLLIGVKDNGTVAGVRNEEDVYVVEQAAEMYCRPAQRVEFAAFRVDASAVVIQASVARATERPVQARDAAGGWTAYYRVADENIHAHPLMVAAWRLRAEGGGGVVLRAGGDESRLLAWVASCGAEGAAPDAVAPALAMSRARAAGIIARLAAIGMLDFVYAPGGFRLVSADLAE